MARAHAALLGVALLTVTGVATADEATAVATFHSLGLYWNPDSGAAADRQAQVRFRDGDGSWRDGLPVRYNPIADADEDLTPNEPVPSPMPWPSTCTGAG
jgi:hypothetical protein